MYMCPLQIPLHLPFESRSLREQKDLLGFEDVAESLITPQERKDTKRSDPGSGGGVSDKTRFNINQLALSDRRHSSNNHNNSTVKREGARHAEEDREGVQEALERANREDEVEEAEAEDQQEDNQQSGSQKKNNLKKYSTTFSSPQPNTPVAEAKYEKLLIPQERYKSTLPKIIITASASVSASNGKKLNYSLGNLLGQGELKIPPLTYDDYKEEDVVLDPFFQDVPKIKKQ